MLYFIDITDLENSYFKDNLKYVMIALIALIENDVIENNILIEYEIELDIQKKY